MRHKLLSLFFCLFGGIIVCGPAAYGRDRIEEIRNRLADPNGKTVLVVAHRGDWRYAPENSLAAIENVIEMGCDIVEIDVQKTRDGHLILMHDNTLNRTTTGNGKVSDRTLEEIRKLRLKNGLGIRTRHAVPTLEEALLLAKDRIMLNLDKAYPYFDEVYALLEKTGTTRQVILKGGQSVGQVKKEFGPYLDRVIFMPVVNLDRANALETVEGYLREYPPLAFEFTYTSDTNPLPKELGERLKGKSLVWYNTLWDTLAGGHDDDTGLKNPDRSYGYLIDTLNARILQTDVPAFLLDYLKKEGRRKGTR